MKRAPEPMITPASKQSKPQEPLSRPASSRRDQSIDHEHNLHRPEGGEPPESES
jgi:hypothetical protein